MIKLGLSIRQLGYHAGGWRRADVPAAGAMDIDHFVHVAQTAERGLMDMVFLADGVALRQRDEPPGSLARSNQNVELEPLTLLAAVAMMTRRIGLVATASTTYNEPFHVARKFASLDHISRGRAGWNVVTSWSQAEARNFNREEHLDYDTRYDRAAEFVDVVRGLWDSWDADAFAHDKASGLFFHPERMHALDHRGPHFQVRGPLTVARSPQGAPVIVQAGTSEQGQEIAAASADVVFTAQQDLPTAQAYYAAVKRRLPRHGRAETDLLLLPGLLPIVGRTTAEAQDKFEALQALIHPLVGLQNLYGPMGDLSGHDLDGPVPEPLDPEMRSRARVLLELARREDLTIRQLYLRASIGRGHRVVVGTPSTIVDAMQEWVEARAADGFNIIPTHLPGGAEEFVDLVVPELQHRGLYRTAYEGQTLRENLGLPRPRQPLRPRHGGRPMTILHTVRALAVALLLGAPAWAQTPPKTTLNVAASADLTGLDPMAPGATGTYIHGMLVYDTLFAQTEQLAIRPQMVGQETISPDKLTYTLTLRPGLRFHDGSPVTTADVIASLRRWMGLDIVGRTMAADVAGMDAVDAETFVIHLKRPFPVEQALANSGSGLAAIMRAQDAGAGPFSRTTPVIGSGPFRFLADEWVPGDKFVYARFDGYVPRAEPPDGLAGGKIPKLDRIVFHVMPDASTKALALQTGEVDFIDALAFDQAEVLAERPGITVGRLSNTYNTFFIRPNALYPPFDNPKARQALALAVNQVDYMTVSFVKPDWGQPCLSFFVCGSPNGITTGSAPYAHQDLARARQLLIESGYKGEPVVLINSHETLFVGQAGDFAADNLKQIGLNIEVAESDWGTFMTRRNNKAPPNHGGWNLFITSVSGSGTYSPLSNSTADTTCGARNFAGWTCDEAAANLRDAYIHEPDPARQREILEKLSLRLWEVMPTIILGQRAQLYAWRNNVTGFVHPPSLVTVFWNIEKSGK